VEEEEDDAVEEVGNEGIRVSPSRRTLFISNLSWASASYRSKLIYRLFTFCPEQEIKQWPHI
jgi:hypothetical protein